MIRLNAKEFDEIVTYIREHYGINLEKKQVLIECRLARELERRGITSFARYMELMKNDRTGIMAVSYTHLSDSCGLSLQGGPGRCVGTEDDRG